MGAGEFLFFLFCAIKDDIWLTYIAERTRTWLEAVAQEEELNCSCLGLSNGRFYGYVSARLDEVDIYMNHYKGLGLEFFSFSLCYLTYCTNRYLKMRIGLHWHVHVLCDINQYIIPHNYVHSIYLKLNNNKKNHSSSSLSTGTTLSPTITVLSSSFPKISPSPRQTCLPKYVLPSTLLVFANVANGSSPLTPVNWSIHTIWHR